MSQFYSDPERETDPYALPDVEVFYNNGSKIEGEDGEMLPAGFYWWFCFPGCLPDGDPFGPFASIADAQSDARRYVGTED
jgi:hypothetical protein